MAVTPFSIIGSYLAFRERPRPPNVRNVQLRNFDPDLARLRTTIRPANVLPEVGTGLPQLFSVHHTAAGGWREEKLFTIGRVIAESG